MYKCILNSDIPLTVKLKHPILSPASVSAPHCKTIALGWNVSITFVIMGTNIDS